jgi:3-dehydroquinate synthase
MRVKAVIVNADVEEKNLRRVLNFGHTLGHAIESWSIANMEIPLLHGEAVVLGMILATRLSVLKCGLAEETAKEISDVLQQNFAVEFEEHIPFDQLAALLFQDKKVRNGEIQFSLISEIGNAVPGITVSLKEVAAVFV